MKHYLALAHAVYLCAASAAIGADTIITIPVPPKPTLEVVSGIRMSCKGSLMDFAGPREATNGVSWVINRKKAFGETLDISYINQNGQPVSSKMIPSIPQVIEATRPELIQAGNSLGLSWTGRLTQAELSACVSYAVIKKIGSAVISDPAQLNAWTADVVNNAFGPSVLP